MPDVLEADRATPEALVNQASALKAQGRLKEAERCAREALRLAPGLAEAHCNLGAVLLEEGRLEEAEAACCRALELKPALAEAHANLVAICSSRIASRKPRPAVNWPSG